MSDTASPSSESVVVHQNDGENRYELNVAGEFAGFVAYRDRGEQRIFYHTEIKEAFGGRGLSTVLVTEALSDARKTGKRVVAVCPFVAAYLRKHPEFDDIADPVTPEIKSWLETRD